LILDLSREVLVMRPNTYGSGNMTGAAARNDYFFVSRILRRVPPKMLACASCPTPQVSSILR